jgi:hypothetical protein
LSLLLCCGDEQLHILDSILAEIVVKILPITTQALGASVDSRISLILGGGMQLI